jgi:putative hydrolase of the HAD superfamily
MEAGFVFRGRRGFGMVRDLLRPPCEPAFMIEIIGFDADDTLWHNEKFFHLTQASFAELLGDYAEKDHLAARLFEAEKRNLALYGFGVKGFTLSMIETAIEVCDETLPPSVIRKILEAGRAMLETPIELLPHVETAIAALRPGHRLVLVTKGDLFDQERKVAQSGLGEFFDAVEIVSDKTPAVYGAICERLGAPVARAVMVGNSMKSDVLPMIAAGGHGVFVPHGLSWAMEHADPPTGHPRFHEIADLGELPSLIEQLGSRRSGQN